MAAHCCKVWIDEDRKKFQAGEGSGQWSRDDTKWTLNLVENPPVFNSSISAIPPLLPPLHSPYL